MQYRRRSKEANALAAAHMHDMFGVSIGVVHSDLFIPLYTSISPLIMSPASSRKAGGGAYIWEHETEKTMPQMRYVCFVGSIDNKLW